MKPDWMLLALGAATAATLAFVATRVDAGAGIAADGGGAAAETREVRLLDGSLVRAPARPTRILPATTAALDWLAPLVAPERFAAIPNLAREYAVIGRDGGPLLARPEFGEYTSEELLAFEPDLVLVQEWNSPATSDRLRSVGVTVVPLPLVSTWREVIDGTLMLGELTGEGARAEALVAQLAARREALRSARAGRAPRVVVYTNYNSGGLGTVTGRGTTMDLVLELAGARNAAAEAGHAQFADASHELLFALDPDVLVIGVEEDGSSTTREYLRATEALAGLRALREGRVVELEGRLLQAASHHVLDAAEALGAALGALGE